MTLYLSNSIQISKQIYYNFNFPVVIKIIYLNIKIIHFGPKMGTNDFSIFLLKWVDVVHNLKPLI